MKIAYNLLGVIILLITIGCSSPASKDLAEIQEIKIGAILPLTENSVAEIGEAMQQGILLAEEEINQEGGIQGKKLKIIIEDDQYKITNAVKISQKLIEIDQVQTTLIWAINTAKAISPSFESKQIPLIILWDANKEIETLGNYTYGIGFSTEKAGQVMAELSIKKEAKTAAIIYHKDEWSQLIAKSFKNRFKEQGGEVIFEEGLSPDQKDFKTEILKAKKADIIYAPLIDALDIFFIQAKELGYKGILATGDGFTEETVVNAKGAAEGVYFTQVYAEENEKILNLKQKYKKKFGKDPELLVFTALGYDGVYLIKQAILSAQSTDPVAIHNALYEIEHKGAAGTININEKGVSEKEERIFIVEAGKFILVE